MRVLEFFIVFNDRHECVGKSAITSESQSFELRACEGNKAKQWWKVEIPFLATCK